MKKIAILTRRAGYNMGSSLQAYAMSKFISNLGYDTTILDYDESARYWKWRIKPLVNRIIYIVLRCTAFVAKKIVPAQYTRYKRMFTQISKFEKFEKLFMPLSDEKYRKAIDFRKTISSYDAYVCGSDQIWSPSFFDPNFLFDFVTPQDNILTVAYSPSIGVVERASLPEEEQQMIKRIKHISCREKEGAAVLSEIVGKDVPVTLDPTLMLSRDDWDEIATKDKIIDGEYILTYFLHNDYFEEPKLAVDFVEKLRAETGLKVINVQMFNMSQIVSADQHLYDCNPSDFLSLIANAKYVCTNSFHCCVFSFQYEKKFYVFERYSKEREKHINQNPRIYTLLNMINSPESLITELDAPVDVNEIVDYSTGLAKLEEMCESSKVYINGTLQSV